MAHSAQLNPVLGTTKTEHLREAVASQRIEQDPQDWFLLYEAARGREVD